MISFDDAKVYAEKNDMGECWISPGWHVFKGCPNSVKKYLKMRGCLPSKNFIGSDEKEGERVYFRFLPNRVILWAIRGA